MKKLNLLLLALFQVLLPPQFLFSEENILTLEEQKQLIVDYEELSEDWRKKDEALSQIKKESMLKEESLNQKEINLNEREESLNQREKTMNELNQQLKEITDSYRESNRKQLKKTMTTVTVSFTAGVGFGFILCKLTR